MKNSDFPAEIFEREDFPSQAFYLDRVFECKKMVVYGAGEAFHYFHEIVMRRYGYRPVAILDERFCSGEHFAGIPAYSPDDYSPQDDDEVAIICLGNQQNVDDVALKLDRKGFGAIISLRDIYEIHNPFNLPSELEREGYAYYLRNRADIERAFTLFADELSKKVYLEVLRTHLTRIPSAIPMSAREEQYTPRGIPLPRGYSRFVYCGASVGEMRRVFRQVGKIRELICLEPDPGQYPLVRNFLAEHRTQIADRITLLPCAVYSSQAIERFVTSDTSFGSRVEPSGTHLVQTITLDDTFPGFPATFINMDIEGAELEALRGAVRMICDHRPDLAICVYHSPGHLWEIPLFLQALVPEYRFYLRNYTSFVSETVLYASGFWG